MNLFIGTYTKKDSKGIYLITIDNKKISDPILVASINNPTYSQIDEENDILYCNNSIDSGSNISSFKILKDGSLDHICDSFTNNANACYLAIDNFSKRIYSAIYHGAIIESRKYEKNGKIEEPDIKIQVNGSGPNKSRQEAAHLHITYPHNGYIFCCDLGSDKIRVFNTKTMQFISETDVRPGSGPRHITIINDFAYIITELSNEIIVAGISNEFHLDIIGYYPLIPNTFTGESIASAIRTSNDCKYLYTANRGYDHINVFKINEDHSLTNIQNVHSGGHWCRDFNISPCGKYLIATHEKSYEVALFEIGNDGCLNLIDNSTRIPEATCINFYKK